MLLLLWTENMTLFLCMLVAALCFITKFVRLAHFSFKKSFTVPAISLSHLMSALSLTCDTYNIRG